MLDACFVPVLLYRPFGSHHKRSQIQQLKDSSLLSKTCPSTLNRREVRFEEKFSRPDSHYRFLFRVFQPGSLAAIGGFYSNRAKPGRTSHRADGADAR